MTGDTPRHVKELVLNPAHAHQEIVLDPKEDPDGQDRAVGEGFVVNRQMEERFENGVRKKSKA